MIYLPSCTYSIIRIVRTRETSTYRTNLIITMIIYRANLSTAFFIKKINTNCVRKKIAKNTFIQRHQTCTRVLKFELEDYRASLRCAGGNNGHARLIACISSNESEILDKIYSPCKCLVNFNDAANLGFYSISELFLYIG